MDRIGSIADRSDRLKLRFTGEQAGWFLHQMLTQSFEDMAPGDARDAALITVHGRMKAFVEAVATQDAFLIHGEPSLRGSLEEELRRYVFATRVEIADVTDELGLVLIVAPGWRELAGEAGVDVIALHPTTALGPEAGYVWMGRADVGTALSALTARGASVVSEESLEQIRIAHGVPRWGVDMDEKTFPQEAGIDERAVHYDKGCYLGQEAMAKIHFRGKVNRRLALLTSEDDLTAGAEVRFQDEKVGSVTSAAGGSALALVRYTVEPGAQVEAGGVPATVA